MAFDFDAAVGLKHSTTATAAPVGSAKVGFDFDAAVGIKPPEVGGLRAAAKQVVGSTIKGAGQIGADFIPGVGADNALVRKGQEIIDANPTAIQGLGDIADKPGTFIKEAVGNALPSVGGMLGLRALGAGITAAAPLAGPAAPLVAGAGQLVSWAGPTVVAALPSYSGIRDTQEDDSLTSKLVGAGASALVGRIEQMTGGEALASKLISKAGRDQLTKATGKMAMAKTVGKEAGKAAVGEAMEEGLQSPIEQLAGYQNPLTAENLQETALGMTMGAVGGGVLGGAMGPFVHTAAKDAPPPDPTVEEVQRRALSTATGGEVEINNGLATITRGENTLTAPVEALTQHFVAGKTLDDFDTAAATAPKLDALRTALQNDDDPLSFNDIVALRDDPEALKQVGVNRKDIDAMIEAEIERGVLPDAAWIQQERLAQQTNQAAFERLQGLDARVQAAQANDALNQTMDEQVSDYWTRLLQVPPSTAPAGTSPAVGPPPSPTDTSPAGAVVPTPASISRLTELEQKAQGLPGVSTPTSLTMQEEQEYIALRAQVAPADAQALQQYQANVTRHDALMLKQQGSPAFETVGEGGQTTVVPAAPPQTLTLKEQMELAQLTSVTKQPPVSPYTDDSRTLAAGLPASQSDTLFSQGAQQGEPLNAPALTSTIDKEFGKGTVSRLTRQGKVQIVASAAEVPGVGPLSADQQRKAQGVYRSKEGKIYLVANNLSKSTVLGVFKHEVVHALLRQDAAFMARREALLKDFEKLMGKDASVGAAAAKVPAGTPEAVRTEEILAYWTQNEANHKHSLFKRMVAVVKAALKRLGIPTTSMTPADFSLLFARGTQEFVGSTQSTIGVGETVKALYSQVAEMFGPKWRSRLAEAVQSKGSTQSASNWLKTLETWEKKGTVPAPVQEELEWSGLKEYLQGLGDQKISRTDIVNYLSENGVQVQEVVKGETIPEPTKEEEARYYELQEKLRTDDLTAEEWAEHDALYERLWGSQGVAGENETKFSSYQLPGGQNYKELLLTLPVEGSRDKAIKSFQQRVRTRLGKQSFDYEDMTDAEVAEYDRLVGSENTKQKYQSSHFDEPNIIAHVRFNERVDAEGNKVLFIEEVQSDWHQEGRRKGYKDPGADAKLAAFDRQIEALTARMREAVKANDDPLFDSLNEQKKNLQAQRRALSISTSKTPPDAPFKNSWSLLAMKRIIRYAAENGFDKIAWTTGEQQAERYDLSKQVSTVSYRPALNRLTAYDLNGNRVLEQDAKPEQIENYIGKEAAKKLLETKVDAFGEHSLTGESLKVGGEGMKAFYDKMLPSSVGKFIKQFGGKVETVLFGDRTDAYFVRQDPEGFSVVLKTNGNVLKTFASQADAEKVAAGWNASIGKVREKNKTIAVNDQPGFTLTPAMRESALGEGMPLFSQRDADTLFSQASTAHAAARARTTSALKEIANDKITEFSPFFLRVSPLRTLVQTLGTKIKQIGAISNAFDEMNHISTSMVEDAKGNYDEHQKLNKKATGNNDKFNLAATTATFYRMMPWKNMEEQDWVPANVANRPRGDKLAAAEVRWKAAGMDKATGKSFIAAYTEAAKAYHAIGSQEAQDQYRKMARHMRHIRQREETNVLATIENATIGNATLRAAMMERFNATFKNISGTYWPLTREGEYILQYKDAGGQPVVEHFLTAKDRRLARQALAESGATEIQQGYASKTPRGQVAIPGELMQQFSQAIVAEKTKGLDPEQDAEAFQAAAAQAQDTINDLNQIWLRWQPETAALKNAIQRRNVKGYDLNAGRAYLEYVQRHAQSIAWTEQGRIIEDQLKGLQDLIKTERKEGKNVDLKQMVLNDLRERVQAARDTHVGPVASLLGKLGTAYYMTSPSIALVQMTQLPILTLPKLGVMYNSGTKAAKALMTAVQDSFSKKFSRDAMYGDQEVNDLFNATRLVVTDEMRQTGEMAGRALGDKVYSDKEIAESFAKLSPYQQKLFILRESLARSLLDISATHEAYAIAQGKNPDSAWRKAFDLAMTPMRLSEQASRKAAILATMELAQAQGKGYNRIMSDVHEVVQDTLFSYDKTNKPVFLQGSTGRVLAMFQWYRIMSMFRMGLLFKRSIAAESEEIKAAARKELIGIVGMSGALAGTIGLPMASAMFAALNAALGDDDEPVDTELEWRNMLREQFGERLGDIAAYGLPAALGMHLTKRIGMGDTFGMQSSPPPQMAGKDLAAWWAANQLGPAFSIGQSWVQGYDEIVNKGNVMRGLEVALPKPLKDAMKAYRVGTEGEMTTIAGKRVLGPDKITADMVPLLALGFNPLEAAKVNENTYSRTKLGAQISRRRGRLIEDAAQALQGEGDVFEAKQALMDFNRKNPAFAIKGGEIRVAAIRGMKEGLGVPSKRERMLNSAYGIPPVE